MDGREFYHKIDAHPELEWLGSKLGVSPELDRVFIGCPSAAGGTNGVRFEISPTAILDPTTVWEDLECVFTGCRVPQVLDHLTRIVGYYSRKRGWNRSKIAELADRQKGDYGVPAQSTVEGPAAPTPWPAGLSGLTSRKEGPTA